MGNCCSIDTAGSADTQGGIAQGQAGPDSASHVHPLLPGDTNSGGGAGGNSGQKGGSGRLSTPTRADTADQEK